MSKNRNGFTIIEVIIVLAIAGLILLLVFLTVPTLQRNVRDYNRKRYADFLASQMFQYKADHASYPSTPEEACSFLTQYASESGPAVVDCSSFDGIGHMTATSHGFVVAYFNNDVDHGYVGPLDEIDITLSHWCNTNPAQFGEVPSHKITNGNEWPFDQLFSRFVIWTALEGSQNGYCTDDYPRPN